jgi:AcrR family transcriptional regulator
MPNQNTKSGRRRAPTAAQAMPKLTLRAQRLQSTGAGILQSALMHFARHGYEGASLRDIAADAGVNHGMIRHIYGSKEEVWRAAITFLFERLDREVSLDDEVQAGRSDRELFTTYVHRYVRYCAHHPEHARIMIQQSAQKGPTLDWAIRRFIRARHRVAGPVIERLRDKGELPDVDAYSLAFSLAASCQLYFVLAPEVKSLTARDVFRPEQIERHAQAVVRIFLRP